MRGKKEPFHGGQQSLLGPTITRPRVRGKEIGVPAELGRAAGGYPKKMTKGLRRQLEKVARQNPEEAERQRRLIGR